MTRSRPMRSLVRNMPSADTLGPPTFSSDNRNRASGKLAFRLIWDRGGTMIASLVIRRGSSSSSNLKTVISMKHECVPVDVVNSAWILAVPGFSAFSRTEIESCSSYSMPASEKIPFTSITSGWFVCHLTFEFNVPKNRKSNCILFFFGRFQH